MHSNSLRSLDVRTNLNVQGRARLHANSYNSVFYLQSAYKAPETHSCATLAQERVGYEPLISKSL